jgi:tripartite-type tricarboxylate transporter receptor subunit TctC
MLNTISRISAALLSCAAMTATTAMAAGYPEQPVTVIVSSSPGSGGDIIARTYQPYMEKCLGTTVVVINKPGAGGALAFAELRDSPPDGYTVGNINMPNTVAQAIERGTPPPWEIYEYVANVTESRVGLHLSSKSPFKDFAEFLAYAKANPKVMTLALGGFGNDDHITQLRAMKAMGIEMTLVPMGDSALARNAMLGGHVTAFSSTVYETRQFKDDIRTMWYASETRNPLVPEVPTLKDLGYDIVGGSNQIIGAAKGTPPEALEKLRGCYQSVFADPAFIKEATDRAIPLKYMSAADTEAFARAQWEPLNELWKTTPWAQK